MSLCPAYVLRPWSWLSGTLILSVRHFRKASLMMEDFLIAGSVLLSPGLDKEGKVT